MYPQRQHYQTMDAGTLYHQPPLPPQQQRSYPTPQPEPLPSATDVHTAALSISQMAEFSSTMVYLMWHERSPAVLPLQPTMLHSSPSSGTGGASNAFRKYCRSILQATQLSESVVLLSLKYIALLLRNNPQLRGAEGSEYRLYTVALMLANKFLDDNTFTNKTWSDISGMKMYELNVMEFEFLDVLRYALFIPKVDFDHWKTTLFNFRNKLYDPAMNDANRRGPQHQQLIESTLKNMGLPIQYHQQQQQQDAQWQQHQQYQQQEAARQQQQQQQQQQQAAAAAVAQQQYNQHLYLLSKAQQPHIPPQPLNRPLTRVPLRIPARPLYQTQNVQQQQAPPQLPSTVASNPSGSNTATVYDPSIGVSVTGTSATVIQPASATMPQQSYATSASTMGPMPTTGRRTPIVPSTTDSAFPVTPYSSQPPQQQQQPPARIVTNPTQRPYDYTRPSVTDDANIYPGQPKQPAPLSAHVITPSVLSHANYMPSSATPSAVPQHMSSSSTGLRTTSLPSAGLEAPSVPPPQHANTMGSGLTAMATAPPLQPQQQQQQQQQSQQPSSSPFYYNTPSATPTSSHPHHPSPHHVVSSDHHPPPAAFVNGTPNNTHFNTTYGNQPRHAPRPTVTTNNPVINHPGRPSYYMDPAQQHQQQPVVGSQHQQQALATPTSSMMDYSYSGTSTNPAMYGRPPTGRTSSNPSYHNPYNVPSGGPSPDHLPQQQDYRPQASASPYAKQPSAPKPTSGPVPEDPLTAAESYRVPSRK